MGHFTKGLPDLLKKKIDFIRDWDAEILQDVSYFYSKLISEYEQKILDLENEKKDNAQSSDKYKENRQYRAHRRLPECCVFG